MSLTRSPNLAQLMRDHPVWLDPEPIPASVSLGTIHPDPLIAALLYRRGIRDQAAARDFLDTRRRPAPPESIVPNMAAAIDRVASAIDTRERIGIFGDYDVDGVTSTALLVHALGCAIDRDHVLPVLPERANGYGLHRSGIDRIVASGATLMICVDCGSTDHEHVAVARERGLDVVILDHHQMHDAGPEGAIVASPQLSADSTYHQLTGVGLTWLLVSGLAARGYHVAPEGATEDDYLDLVALGTVADVAQLIGINRTFVRQGVDVLRSTRRPGMAALISESRLNQRGIEASHIAFQLAPRINAAGRLASATAALDLLLSEDPREAIFLAQDLNKHNLNRRSKQDLAVSDATREILALPDWESRGYIGVVSPDWEPGLIGVVAGKLCETLRRPVIVFRQDGDTLVGSARSVRGFDIAEALRGVSHLLLTHGGHEQAAGLSLPSSRLQEFTDSMLKAVAASGLQVPAPKTIAIDANLDEAHLSTGTVRAIAAMQPFGQGNIQPVLRVRGAQMLRYTTMSEGKHLKLFVRAGSKQFEAIQWGAGWRSPELLKAHTVDLAGKLDINEFNGQTRLQMLLDDFRVN